VILELDAVNRCQISEMEKAARELDPGSPDSCIQFGRHVQNVQAAIIHTYQIVAYQAIRDKDPAVAAARWKAMSDFCDAALATLKDLKNAHPHCGTPELYDLALDYKSAAFDRYLANQEDSECLKANKGEIPSGLFPKMR
jgi:hypothetical protein